MILKSSMSTNIFTFQDYKSTPDPVYEVNVECLQPSPVPIIIDNGSFQTRAGWACDELSSPRLQFKSVAARSRGAARSETQIGNDIPNLEPLRWLLKSQFDRNAVVNFEIQELMFDYVFMHLGIATQGCVEHPVVLTEPPCNPLHCRQMMSELLFECYGVPQVSYGIDSLFSFYLNNKQRSMDTPHTGLVISSGYHCSHVLPVINGRLDAANCKRVNVGGSQAASYLQRLLQLKYPGQQPALTLSRMEELLHQHSYIASDYQQELEKWRSPEFYEQEVHRIQLPFSAKLAGAAGVGAEERQERRANQLRRLQEINARRREEKIQQDQERLDSLLAVQELLEDGLVDQFQRRLVELNMDSTEELQSYIHKISMNLELSRQRNLLQEGLDNRAEALDLDQSMEEGDGAADTDPDFGEENTEVERSVNVSQPALKLAEYHQLYVGTERLRAPEVIFQPSMIGEDQMGLMETVQFVLDRYTPEQQGALVENVLLTGGNLMYPGLRDRVESELLAIRPFQSYFKVRLASRPALDAWYGAREWALQNPPGELGWLSRQDYEEKGGEYLSEHCASNVFIPMAICRPTQRANEAVPASELTLPTESGQATGPVAVAMETTPVSGADASLSDTREASSNMHSNTDPLIST
ncbi:actin-related protein 5 [Alosa sapidissima]|uniref:actin-related protein 5 n=1 Tax=Alosa sapidissima TaxID=34773 RepID=UPI001C088C31|nr:actin-related protein 5 [Alosa sapidissima]